ncbi:MAG: elongation factor G [Dehalococcoidales bacterium]|nr:elongation factor G [Dehalococcoidales bacterium]
MEQFGQENIRNVALLSHSGAGKTSIAEAILFNSKIINRLGKVDDGSTISDFDPDEIKRKISISLSLLPYVWQNVKVNLIDTPGYADFVGEVKSGLRVSEGAVIVICAASGVEVGTELVWQYCEEAELPRLIFINKMDRENADFFKVAEAAQKQFGVKCVPVQIPIGSYSSFSGVVDLVKMKAIKGDPAQEENIPVEIKAQADTYRNKLVEAVAGADENLIEKYLNDETITQEELEQALNTAVSSGKLVPIYSGSALQNSSITLLMNAIRQYLPSPAGIQVEITDPSKEEKQKIDPSPSESLAALVFKTSADPYVGKMTYFRVYTGTLSSNSQIWNSTRNEQERVGQLFIVRGKNQEPASQVIAGDIGVVTKLNVTSTGDTLCIKEKPMKLDPIVFPVPVYSGAVTPKTKADLDKLGTSLARLSEEDPTVKVHRDTDTGEMVLSGLGETQLEVIVERMQRKFGVGVNLDTPKVPYKETITSAAKGEYKHKKQTGGHGQYGHVLLEVEPLPRGTGLEFLDAIVGGTIPRNYIPAVEKGVRDAVHEGVVAGFPVVDVRARVYDGSFHPVDSSEICFKIAGAGALRKAMDSANPVLLEPIVKLKVVVPDSYTGDIMSDLNNKRGRVMGMMPEGGKNTIEAEVPLAEILRYAIDLKSITQGRGRYSYELSNYEEVPTFIAQKICAERKAELEAKSSEKKE